MRINKLFSQIGICSRRETDRLINDGCIFINGRLASLGMDVNTKDTIKIVADKNYNIDEKFLSLLSSDVQVSSLLKEDKYLIAFNKPRGIVCSCSNNDRAVNVIEFINFHTRIYPIGRLDKESQGLLLLTNDGDIANELTKVSNGHEKEYEVVVDKHINKEFLTKMRQGIYLKELNKKTMPCTVNYIDTNSFSIVLKQGLNRQIRRMCKALGYEVLILKRVRINNYNLGDLSLGHYKIIDKKEVF